NIPALLDRFTEDINWAIYSNPDVPFAKSYKGKSATAQFFKDLDNSVNFNVFSPEKFYADEDMVFVKTHEVATVKSTGKTYDHQVLMTFKIRDGKICDFFAYGDTAAQSRAYSK
ncbi:MAG TPA: nuclear transport factor 2 family protein, partial [Prolixibacteraceae bacterium]|nr:nuclear transport factor 2 family protein [Prolixibacteraceae bacterium]